MNKLAGGSGCGFRVSNKQDPCTVGVDLCANTVPLKTFCAVEDSASSSLKARVPPDMRVGFVDAEGQGDRDSAYDARIACPVLLAAKCVLFNWRDSLQKDRILDLLGVMCRAAASVDVGGDGAPAAAAAAAAASSSPSASKPFGHLHIVFRDWNFDGDVASVERQLLGLEADDSGKGGGSSIDALGGGGSDAAKRNAVRRSLVSAFESVSVWLLPSPVERTKDLQKVLTPDLLSREFNDAVKSLRGSLCVQLAEGPRQWAGQPLTGPKLSQLIPMVAEALNRDGLVLPCSAFESMLRAELAAAQAHAEQQAVKACSEALRRSCDLAPGLFSRASSKACEAWKQGGDACEAGDNDNVTSLAVGEAVRDFESLLGRLVEGVEVEFKTEVCENITQDAAVVEAALASLRAKALEEKGRVRLQFHRTAVWPFAIKSSRERLEAASGDLFACLPLPMEVVKTKLEALLGQLVKGLRTCAADAGLGDDGGGGSGSGAEVENAVQSLTDKAQLVLQHLSARNDELDLERQEKQAELADEAANALVARMTSEEAKAGQDAIKKGHSAGSRGLLEPRRQELCAAVSAQLKARLLSGSDEDDGGGCPEARLEELLGKVEAASVSALANLKAERARVLQHDLDELTERRCNALREVVANDILPLASDSSDDAFDPNKSDDDDDDDDLASSSSSSSSSGGGGGRVSLSELLQRLATASDLAFSQVAAKANVPPNAASPVPPGHGLAQEVRRLVKASKQRMDEVVAGERLKIQLAKEESDALVRCARESKVAKAAQLAVKRAEQERERLAADEERRRIDRDAKQRKADEKARVEAEAAARAEAREEAEAEALRLATAAAQGKAEGLAKERAKAAATEHAKELKRLKAEKKSAEVESARLKAVGAAARAAEEEESDDDDAGADMEDDISDDEEEQVIVKAKPKAASARKSTAAAAKSTPKKKAGPKLSLAEVKAQARKEIDDRASAKTGMPSSSSSSSAKKKRQSSPGTSAKRSRT